MRFLSSQHKHPADHLVQSSPHHNLSLSSSLSTTYALLAPSFRPLLCCIRLSPSSSFLPPLCSIRLSPSSSFRPPISSLRPSPSSSPAVLSSLRSSLRLYHSYSPIPLRIFALVHPQNFRCILFLLYHCIFMLTNTPNYTLLVSFGCTHPILSQTITFVVPITSFTTYMPSIREL